ncbi:hypothetical protein M5D96_011026, partial [Drosophila gunungcola]
RSQLVSVRPPELFPLVRSRNKFRDKQEKTESCNFLFCFRQYFFYVRIFTATFSKTKNIRVSPVVRNSGRENRRKRGRKVKTKKRKLLIKL